MATIDMTNPGWGHNLEIMKWDTSPAKARAAIWVTPPPVVDDIVLLRGQSSIIRAIITAVDWCRDPGDMYFLDLKPAPTEGT